MAFVATPAAVQPDVGRPAGDEARSWRRPDAMAPQGTTLDAATQQAIGRRFGYDLRNVRVFADEHADRAAATRGARAFAAGTDIVFARGEYAPHTRAGRLLLTHELAHVVQTAGAAPVGPEGSGTAAVEADADRAAVAALRPGAAPGAARPALRAPAALHCKKHETGRVQYGEYTVDIDDNPLASHQADVHIEFMPDAAGPKTDHIEFVQIATAKAGDGHREPWTPLHRDQPELDRSLTSGRDAAHQTKAGDTLASVATAHYGSPDRAAEIRQANQQHALPADPSVPLPVGLLLVIPRAVVADYNVDIDYTGVRPRGGPTDAPISPRYPHLSGRPAASGGTIQGPGGLTFPSGAGAAFVRAIGRNPAGGTPESARMEDQPGRGYLRERFSFETSAHAEDIGVTYGAVQWGFDHDPYPTGGAKPITNEFVRIVPGQSDTARAALVAFNKELNNRYVIQQGDTLRSVALAYYNDSRAAYAIFKTNPGILPSFSADAPLPAGKELTMPQSWSAAWDIARFGGDGGVQRSPEELAQARMPVTPPLHRRLRWPTP